MKTTKKTADKAANTETKTATTDKQKELKRLRDARYRAKKRAMKAANAPKSVKADKKPVSNAPNSKIVQVKCNAAVPEDMRDIFEMFVSRITGHVANESAHLLRCLSAAITMANREKAKAAKKTAKK